MVAASVHQLSERYTGLTDRFRSLWTFYQFLAGVFKHTGRGSIPYRYDFQALYKRLQDLVPQVGQADEKGPEHELDLVERELLRIREKLAEIEADFAPSTLRRFFDHLKRQDEKILYALVKFYLGEEQLSEDRMDKLDILLTRLAEAPLENGRSLQRDPAELRNSFERLALFAGLQPVSAGEEEPIIESVREIRREIQVVDDFDTLLTSGVYDRLRALKKRIGAAFLYPSILVEVVATNIEAKNRFKQLFQIEEVKILEDTNRIFEIERYLERNPDLAHEELNRQIETFRRFRVRFDSGRKDDNIKREDILDLRRAMHAVLRAFDPMVMGSRPGAVEASAAHTAPLPPPLPAGTTPPRPATDVGADSGKVRVATAPDIAAPEAAAERSVVDLLPSDPLLNEFVHKIVFALELVSWDHAPEEAVRAKELHHLRLEPWELEAYRSLAGDQLPGGSIVWELHLFFLTAAALRVRMEEEAEEIGRQNRSGASDRLYAVLERSSQSLERAREFGRRFQWFIDDMLYRGETERLEQIYRSYFRFMNAFSRLWLDHQASGGITPL